MLRGITGLGPTRSLSGDPTMVQVRETVGKAEMTQLTPLSNGKNPLSDFRMVSGRVILQQFSRNRMDQRVLERGFGIQGHRNKEQEVAKG